MQKPCGTTLVEVLIAMAVLAVVSLFAYAGISTGMKLMQQSGKDLQTARAAAEQSLAQARQAEAGAEVQLSVEITDAAGKTQRILLPARRISGADESARVTLYGYLPEAIG